MSERPTSHVVLAHGQGSGHGDIQGKEAIARDRGFEHRAGLRTRRDLNRRRRDDQLLSKKEKKQTRNIAEKEINKAAPGLSVSSANNANNANTLGGNTPANLRSYSAFGQSAVQIGSLGGDPVTVVSATITTQATTRILASGSAQLGGEESSFGECFIDIEGEESLPYESVFKGVGGQVLVIAVNHAVTRPAGTYTASLRCRTLSGTVSKQNAAINLSGLGV